MSVCDHCQYCSYCRSDVNRLKNMIKDLNDENDRLVFDLGIAVMDAKNAKHHLEQERKLFKEQFKKLEGEIWHLKLFVPTNDPDSLQD